MPSAEIITIGTEILLGEIIDTNSRHLARRLREAGIDVYWTSTVGDNVDRIAQAVRLALTRSDIVITTGGLGPTVDDPTREALARAMNVVTEFRPELWEQVIERFRGFNRTPTENNRRQAYIPQGAEAIVNPVGTAPAFRMETDGRVVIALPGVPREMEHLLEDSVIPFLRQRFGLSSLLRVRILRTAGVGESQVDERIADLERLSNPTVGLAAHAGQVDVRIVAKAATEAEAQELIQGVEVELRKRLGDWIYGVDGETLSGVAIRQIEDRGWSLAALESGLDGKLVRQLAGHGPTFLGGELISRLPGDAGEVLQLTADLRDRYQAAVGIGAAQLPGGLRPRILLALLTPDDQRNLELPFGGHPKLAHRRAVNAALDLLRRI